jgi:hypothetical protein
MKIGTISENGNIKAEINISLFKSKAIISIEINEVGDSRS